jgi:uncharacterized membrane protein
VIAGGALVAALMRLARLRQTDGDPYRLFRQQLGRSILLGLVLLVAADIIRTVAVTPNAQSVAVTGGWPWQKAARGARHRCGGPASRHTGEPTC